MGFISQLFSGGKAKSAAPPAKAKTATKPAPASTHFHNSQNSQAPGGSAHSIRKDLLRMVLRETLTRNGIPATWVGADMLRSTSKGREPGIHVRFLVHHWDPRLLVHAVAFEQNFGKRLLTMDPLANNWMMGMSWQYAMEDTSECPELPHPGSWTAASAPAAAVGMMATQPFSMATQPMAAGDVIAGPVTIAKSKDGVKADLDRMLAAGDTQKRSAEDFAATQPIQL